MAIHRDPPKCPFCGKVIGKGKYKDQSKTPPQLQVIGDTFESWDIEEHECPEMKEFKEQNKTFE